LFRGRRRTGVILLLMSVVVPVILGFGATSASADNNNPMGSTPSDGERYTIEYRIMSADATSALPGTPSPAPPAAGPIPAANITYRDRGRWWPYPVIGLSIVALAGTAALLARRRSRRAPSKGSL
jgi:hypothetical protein